MPVPFGFIESTLVRTPSGAVALGAVQVGDAVWAYDTAKSTLVRRTVQALHAEPVDQLVAVDADEVILTGATPGTSIWDAFEGMFRGAGSLSSAGELLSWADGTPRAVQIVEIPERAAPGTRVFHLTLDGDEGAFFADDVLVRHLDVR